MQIRQSSSFFILQSVEGAEDLPPSLSLFLTHSFSGKGAAGLVSGVVRCSGGLHARLMETIRSAPDRQTLKDAYKALTPSRNNCTAFSLKLSMQANRRCDFRSSEIPACTYFRTLYHHGRVSRGASEPGYNWSEGITPVSSSIHSVFRETSVQSSHRSFLSLFLYRCLRIRPALPERCNGKFRSRGLKPSLNSKRVRAGQKQAVRSSDHWRLSRTFDDS